MLCIKQMEGPQRTLIIVIINHISISILISVVLTLKPARREHSVESEVHMNGVCFLLCLIKKPVTLPLHAPLLRKENGI